MEPRDTEDSEDGAERGQRFTANGHAGSPSPRRHQQPRVRRKSGCAARTIMELFAVLLSFILLGLGIKMSLTYDSAPLIHVSVAFVGFTAAASIVWPCIEFLTLWLRRGRGIYAGAHVGVHICLCLATGATMGYMCLWVSAGDHWNSIQINGQPVDYTPLYNMGIVAVTTTVLLLWVSLSPLSAHTVLWASADFDHCRLVHFALSVLACREIGRKDDKDAANYRSIITVRYDGVGPVGTARPRNYHIPEVISLPPDTGRDLARPPRAILGNEVTKGGFRTRPLESSPARSEKSSQSGPSPR
ncbi:hypothetical protein B0H63DRAFT_473121 [Podospora didyma]|uniref:Uncharacterized protein n=1 Tax=Podospora didyma TaxID=330526 RepID=A0AAE0NPX1_9PEZI|nr:hypothetical protein B0H63DRAFT_473121 [Podospora didyma]